MSLRGLRWRMGGITAAAMVLVLLTLGGGVILLGRQLLFDETRSRLEADAAETVQVVGETPGSVRTAQPPGTFILIWGRDGEIVSAPQGINLVPFRASARATTPGHPRVDVVISSGASMLVDSRVAPDRQGNPVGVVQTATPLASLNAAENRLLFSVAAAGAVALVLSGLAAWVVAGRATRPVEAALRRQRQFTADASHELRTPLTVIDASLQVLARHPEKSVGASGDVVESARREVQRMVRMLDGLLTLARTDADDSPSSNLVATDIDELLESIVAESGPRAAQADHSLSLAGEPVGSAEVDPDHLRQVLLILVDNACVHTPAGTPVTIARARLGGALIVDVIDRGPGIAASEREHVFGRFRRLHPGRAGKGSGLGLAIARELATQMGARIHLTDARPGLNARVTVRSS